jgi:hypothetical protein
MSHHFNFEVIVVSVALPAIGSWTVSVITFFPIWGEAPLRVVCKVRCFNPLHISAQSDNSKVVFI